MTEETTQSGAGKGLGIAGLVIGIIAYIAYNVLVARVEKVVYKMEATTIEFMDLLQEPAE